MVCEFELNVGVRKWKLILEWNSQLVGVVQVVQVVRLGPTEVSHHRNLAPPLLVRLCENAGGLNDIR